MGDSLQEQLLKAGLADQAQFDKASKTRKQKSKQARQQGKKAKRAKPPVDPEVQRAREEKAARDRELNARREEARKQRAIAAQIKQLVDANRHPRSNPDNDVPFHFENKGKVKRIHVAPATRNMIVAGKLVIVNANGVFELVPPPVAEKIRARNPSMVIDLPKDEPVDEDDPYAAFKVPDDLSW